MIARLHTCKYGLEGMEALLVRFSLLGCTRSRRKCILQNESRRKARTDRNELRREQAIGVLSSPVGCVAF